MSIHFHRNFKKALKKQPKKIQIKFKEKFRIFEEDQFHYSLNNHTLRGRFLGTRSFDIKGDIRVHYKELDDGIILKDIGTHSQLYD